MESTKQKLADWAEISKRADNKEKLNPIDNFLYINEPAGVEDSEKFRHQLLEALNFDKEFLIHFRSTNYCGQHSREYVEKQMLLGKVVMGAGGGIDCWDVDKSIKICSSCGGPCNT